MIAQIFIAKQKNRKDRHKWPNISPVRMTQTQEDRNEMAQQQLSTVKMHLYTVNYQPHQYEVKTNQLLEALVEAEIRVPREIAIRITKMSNSKQMVDRLELLNMLLWKGEAVTSAKRWNRLIHQIFGDNKFCIRFKPMY